jgi:hypothetical protein
MAIRRQNEAPPVRVLWRSSNDMIEAEGTPKQQFARGELRRLGVVAADLTSVRVVDEQQYDEQHARGDAITPAIRQHIKWPRK